MAGVYGSSFDARRAGSGACGEKSRCWRYFRTVLRSTWRAAAMADTDPPCACQVFLSQRVVTAIILGVWPPLGGV
jgi:hypothetical protein